VLNIRGDHDDDRWANGEFHYSASLTYGDIAISGGDLYQDFDRLNSKTEGAFAKLELYLARLQHISGPLSAFVSVSSQTASKNLDTSQKFYIGGPHTVAGYPSGELSGDDAALLYADLRYDFFDLPWGGNMQLALFYSHGAAKLHHDPWSGWKGSSTHLENEITLRSIGISAHQTWSDQFVLHLLAGRQLGDNIGSDPVTGEDSDHSTKDYRLWVQGIYYF
jgi:hemolysin activation/secretion protein